MEFLFAAYAVVWLIFFVYLIGLHRKQKALADEVALLSKKLPGSGS